MEKDGAIQLRGPGPRGGGTTVGGKCHIQVCVLVTVVALSRFGCFQVGVCLCASVTARATGALAYANMYLRVPLAGCFGDRVR